MKISENEKMNIGIFPTRVEMGQAAGKEIERKIAELQKVNNEVRIIFAAAPSQNEMLDYLACSDVIKWGKIVAFHMDEYIGLENDSGQLFSSYLKKRLFDKVKPGKVNLIETQGNIEEEIERYSSLISESPIDIVCLGIGENGHIAFNDPPVANFNDTVKIKKVMLQDLCRIQQVNDKCFNSLEEVPECALTLTIPVIFSAKYLYCVVPGVSKRSAVKNTLTGPVDTSCPASVLRTHKECRFYFDYESFGELKL
jgi:glucosamine-6-phosphate deaminase